MEIGFIFLIVLALLFPFGRYACGYLCPLGWIEELLYKIPLPWKIKKMPYDRQLRYMKWGVFVLVVIYILLSPYLPESEGWRIGKLVFKITTFSLVFLASLFIVRPFCKYLCPIGLILGLGNKIAFIRYRKKDNCLECGLCSRSCKMGLEPQKDYNSIECIRCGRCKKKCPKKSLVEQYFYQKEKEGK